MTIKATIEVEIRNLVDNDTLNSEFGGDLAQRVREAISDEGLCGIIDEDKIVVVNAAWKE